MCCIWTSTYPSPSAMAEPVPPGSIEDLEMIMAAYARSDNPSTRDEIARFSNVSADTVSRCTKFLESVGLIEGGRNKKPTAVGKSMGMAVTHSHGDEVVRFWRKAIQNSSFLTDLLTYVRLQGGKEAEDLAGQVLYQGQISNNQYSRRGARTVVDLLVKSGYLEEKDGKLQMASDPVREAPPAQEAEVTSPKAAEPTAPADAAEPTAPAPPPSVRVVQASNSVGATIAINIELQLPETSDPVVYDNLFRSLRQHLLNDGSEVDGTE